MGLPAPAQTSESTSDVEEAKISPPPLRAIAAMFFGEIYDSIRGRIVCRQKIKPKSDRLLAHV